MITKTLINRYLAVALTCLFTSAAVWAAPVADVVWHGDFTTTEKTSAGGITYTLDVRGNAVTDESITIDKTVGAQITIGDTASFGGIGAVLVKYRNLNTPTSGTLTLATLSETKNYLPGLRMATEGSNRLTGYHEAHDTNIWTPANNPTPGEQGYFLFSYSAAGGLAIHSGETLESLAGGANTGLHWSSATIRRFNIGGPESSTAHPAWTGMVIEGIAVFNGSFYDGATIADFADFVFPDPPQKKFLKYYFPLDGDATNLGSASIEGKLTTDGEPAFEENAPFGTKSLKAGNGESETGSYVLADEANGLAGYDTGWTLSFWVNPNGMYQWRDVCGFSIGNVPYKLENTATASCEFQIYNDHDTSALNSAIPYTPNEWLNIVIKSSGEDSFSVYANGEAVATWNPDAENPIWGDSEVHALTKVIMGTKGLNAQRPSPALISNIAIYDYAVNEEQIAYLAASEPKDFYAPAKNSSTPVFLANMYNGGTNPAAEPVAGWINNTQNGSSSQIPKTAEWGSDHITSDAGIGFQATGDGNFFNNYNPVSTDFATDGNYVDIFGKTHTTIAEEVATSLSLPEGTVFDASVYKTGIVNGGAGGHTATISNLDPEKLYVIYAGMGLNKQNQTQGFKIEDSGYGSVGALDYVVSENGDNTTASNQYQSFAAGTVINASASGVMIVRLVDITPKADGTIVFNLASTRAGLNFLAVAEVTREGYTKVSATINGNTKWSEIQWKNGATNVAWKDGLSAVIEIAADSTLTIDTDEIVDAKNIVITGSGNLEIVGAQKLSGNIKTPEYTGAATFVFNAETEDYTPDAKYLTFIRTSGHAFKFCGSATTGVLLDYDISGDKRISAEIKSHFIFEEGVHALNYSNNNSILLATGHSEDNPTILVKEGATLNFTARDISGWSGGANITGVIRVNDGGKLNFIERSEGGTFFYRQRLYLEPGAYVSHNFGPASGEGRFRWQGGTDEATAQIYVPASTSDQTSKPAVIEQKGDSALVLASDQTRGLAIYVGEKSKLQMNSAIRVNHTDGTVAQLHTYGAGELEITKAVSIHTLNVHSGTVTFALNDVSEETQTISAAINGSGTIAKKGKNKLVLPAGEYSGTIKILDENSVVESAVERTVASGLENYAVKKDTQAVANKIIYTLELSMTFVKIPSIEHAKVRVTSDGEELTVNDNGYVSALIGATIILNYTAEEEGYYIRNGEISYVVKKDTNNINVSEVVVSNVRLLPVVIKEKKGTKIRILGLSEDGCATPGSTLTIQVALRSGYENLAVYVGDGDDPPDIFDMFEFDQDSGYWKCEYPVLSFLKSVGPFRTDCKKITE